MKKIYNKQKIKKALEIDIYPRGGGKIDLRTLADTADHVVVNDDASDGGSSGGDNEFNAKFIVIPDDAEPSPEAVMEELTGYEQAGNYEYVLTTERYEGYKFNFLANTSGPIFVSDEDELNNVYLPDPFIREQSTIGSAPEFTEYMIDQGFNPQNPEDNLEPGEVALIKHVDGSSRLEIIATYRVYKVKTQSAILPVTSDDERRAYVVSLKFDREITRRKDTQK